MKSEGSAARDIRPAQGEKVCSVCGGTLSFCNGQHSEVDREVADRRRQVELQRTAETPEVTARRLIFQVRGWLKTVCDRNQMRMGEPRYAAITRHLAPDAAWAKHADRFAETYQERFGSELSYGEPTLAKLDNIRILFEEYDTATRRMTELTRPEIKYGRPSDARSSLPNEWGGRRAQL